MAFTGLNWQHLIGTLWDANRMVRENVEDAEIA